MGHQPNPSGWLACCCVVSGVSLCCPPTVGSYGAPAFRLPALLADAACAAVTSLSLSAYRDITDNSHNVTSSHCPLTRCLVCTSQTAQSCLPTQASVIWVATLSAGIWASSCRDWSLHQLIQMPLYKDSDPYGKSISAQMNCHTSS